MTVTVVFRESPRRKYPKARIRICFLDKINTVMLPIK